MEIRVDGVEFTKGAEFYMEDGELKFTSIKSLDKSRHVVYVHVVGEGEERRVVYIGETSNTFYQRMYYYCKHKGRTNVRVREYMLSKIEEGVKVCTYLFKPKEVMVEGGLTINPYVGVEQALIASTQPLLNRKNIFKKE